MDLSHIITSFCKNQHISTVFLIYDKKITLWHKYNVTKQKLVTKRIFLFDYRQTNGKGDRLPVVFDINRSVVELHELLHNGSLL